MEYFSKLHDVNKNITMNEEDSTAWAHYLIQGINYSPVSDDSFTAAQDLHERLFTHLSNYPHREFKLHGLKTHIPLQETMDRINGGIPADFTPETYPITAKDISAFRSRKEKGSLKEFTRVYWLSVQLEDPNTSASHSLLPSFVKTKTWGDTEIEDFTKEERAFFDELPEEFNAERTTPEHMYWVADRVRYRGLKTVPLPDTHDGAGVIHSRGVQSFPPVEIDKYADVQPLLDDFVAEYLEDDDETMERGTRTFRQNYHAAKWSHMLSVSNLDSSNEALPSGLTSFQANLMITKYPEYESTRLMSYTAIVDQYLGVDADFTLLFSFDPSMLQKDSIRKLRSALSYNANSTSKDDLDMAEYQSTGDEMTQFHSNILNNDIPMKVCTIFTFADSNRKRLSKQLEKISTAFSNSGFETSHIGGGQYDMFLQSMPGTKTSKLSEAYKQATTVKRFAPTFPMRRSNSGDLKGIPIAVNKSNALGNIIYYDVLGAPDKGNSSMVALGSQGSGKSYFMKNLIRWTAGLHCVVHVFDPSPHGEYEVFSRALANQDDKVSVDILNFSNPRYNIDPLQIYTDAATAKLKFERIMYPLLGITPESSVSGMITELLGEDNRAVYNIHTTRDLMNHLRGQSSVNTETRSEIERVVNMLRYVGNTTVGRALVDLRGELPPLKASTTMLVYRTHDLKVMKRNEEPTTEKKIGSALYLAASEYTSYLFTSINHPCFTFGDEMSFLSDAPQTLENLVKNPTRQGRKYKNALVAGSQDAEDVDNSAYTQVSKTMVFRQDKDTNAEAALKFAGLPTNQDMVYNLQHETSPRDPNGDGVIPGREGEGWYVDGINFPVRMQTLPSMTTSQHQASNTTASQMLR